MFGKFIELATLSIDIAIDTLTLDRPLINEKSATIEKLDSLSEKKECERTRYKRVIH